jgi:uncharacterized membrane protein
VLHHFSVFFGRLHPVLVHLPIGFLLMALLLRWVSRKPKFEAFASVVPFVLLCGVAGALLACLTGLTLSSEGEYDGNAVMVHMWMGIGTTVIGAWLYSQLRSKQPAKSINYTSLGLLALVTITGHLGGNLTHGSDYLSGAFSDEAAAKKGQTKRAPIADVQQAGAYADIIRPILSEKCYSCHGENKQKGKLRLDQPEFLLKGGKDGQVVIAGKPLESELIKRLMLPLEDEHHMSPKEKAQVTKSEQALLSWWIANGADFTKKVHELPQPAVVKPFLIALQGPGEASGDSMPPANKDIPTSEVDAAETDALAALKSSGVIVLPVAEGSNYLGVDASHAKNFGNAEMALLKPLRRQLVSLKLSGTKVGDEGVKMLAGFDGLIRLHLDHTGVSDAGLGALKMLGHLKYLNLTYTSITEKGLLSLQGMPALKSVWLYQTRIEKSHWANLQQQLKGVSLDSGGYVVPQLETDTAVVKKK